MINLTPQQIQLILDSINLITIKGSDAKFVVLLQTDLESYLESKLEELNLSLPGKEDKSTPEPTKTIKRNKKN
jgi:hypothetical protein